MNFEPWLLRKHEKNKLPKMLRINENMNIFTSMTAKQSLSAAEDHVIKKAPKTTTKSKWLFVWGMFYQINIFLRSR